MNNAFFWQEIDPVVETLAFTHACTCLCYTWIKRDKSVPLANKSRQFCHCDHSIKEVVLIIVILWTKLTKTFKNFENYISACWLLKLVRILHSESKESSFRNSLVFVLPPFKWLYKQIPGIRQWWIWKNFFCSIYNGVEFFPDILTWCCKETCLP